MQILEYEKDRILHCRFRGHVFELERDESDYYSYANWYMVVRDDSGSYACDGWIDDSSHYTAKQAMIAACDGAMLDPPKRWHALNKLTQTNN